MDSAIPFDNSYARLPSRFYAFQHPVPVKKPLLVKINRELLENLGLYWEMFFPQVWGEILSGNRVSEGAEPLAMAYAGHQFGHFVPQLGDGRAILLGEIVDKNGLRRDIQLKGSGPTPFSRNGDGRAALGPVLREYILGEAMHALGIPATRSLAVVLTGEEVLREKRFPGAVLTRVGLSHIRVGTFEFFAAKQDHKALRILAEYTMNRHFPEMTMEKEGPVGLLRAVMEQQASLVAAWMQVGFIHGVMNTDNCALSGETIDFGPCAFMDAYDPMKVFSSIDQAGRYAYARQPQMAHWNLRRFAESLLPLFSDEELEAANAVLGAFPDAFQRHWLSGMGQKLGFLKNMEGDEGRIQSLLKLMHANGADFTLSFRKLCDIAEDPARVSGFTALFREPEACGPWLGDWLHRLDAEDGDGVQRAAAMRKVNPLFIPRNHRVEEVIRAAEDRGDFQPFETLLSVLSRPFDLQPGFEKYAEPPQPHELVHRTFCGT
ncbi:uncharacterized protein YdiU (UPF0061 family) [Desulfobotulus alkaliphilus]|uniref:Protein nucleotidyltransferase YdiU n=1 Tax=Desulfobotulus alkaliphilus TaxID=622671 RepID=A0A562RJ43_9BACT|nr:YdiU family protein [Desulfobotulus alkaliphilus]TWI68584.1 uncharacterized protein YdiU (UPF0061 family) [Desulfobotulus alkaliphilus]